MTRWTTLSSEEATILLKNVARYSKASAPKQ
jgi:hypothetical protein